MAWALGIEFLSGETPEKGKGTTDEVRNLKTRNPKKRRKRSRITLRGDFESRARKSCGMVTDKKRDGRETMREES